MDSSFKSNILPALAIILVVLLFIYIPVNKQNTPVKNFLKQENIRLKKSNDSLNLVIEKNEFIFNEMSRTLLDMANEKREIKYIYNEKYKEIRFFTNSRIIMEFDSIFAKSDLN
jgi:biopolymer transport protein ExbD